MYILNKIKIKIKGIKKYLIYFFHFDSKKKKLILDIFKNVYFSNYKINYEYFIFFSL